MIKINVITNYSSWLDYIKNPSDYIDKKIKKINRKDKKLKKNFFICTLLLSGNKEIKILNRKFRKKNKATDVLSFPFYNKREFIKKLRKGREIYLGDIIVNLNKIKKNELKGFKIEFDRLWVHGLLHLFGFNHKKNKDFRKMIFMEKKYLNYINV